MQGMSLAPSAKTTPASILDHLYELAWLAIGTQYCSVQKSCSLTTSYKVMDDTLNKLQHSAGQACKDRGSNMKVISQAIQRLLCLNGLFRGKVG